MRLDSKISQHLTFSKKKYHFIGIGGIGMSGLARLLLKSGAEVSGSDLSAGYITKALLTEGIGVSMGHSAGHVPDGSVVVYTTGIDDKNPELVAAKEKGCLLLHRSDLLKQLMDQHQSLTIAGTHGKTTTSSLLASALEFAGADLSYAIGGTLVEFQTNAKKGEGAYFVAEACESDGTFTKYDSYGAIITNIDSDHVDFFGTTENLVEAFGRFIKNIMHREYFFWCGDDPLLCQLSPGGYSYGRGEKCDLRVINERQQGWVLFFDVTFKGKVYENLQVPLIGRHNALNAAAVFGLCLSLGLTEKAIKESFLKFQGVHRRCEKKGSVNEVLVVDDYAHHPTEIKTTLAGLRKAIGERRLVVVFQPHCFLRTKECMGSFAEVFSDADEVIVTDIYTAREKPIAGITGQKVADEISTNFRTKCRYISQQNLLNFAADFARPHDAVITMGAGDITLLGGQLLARWKAVPPKKLRIGVVFGGRSMEHEISCRSAEHVIGSLNPSLYEILLFGIQKNGDWVTGPSVEAMPLTVKADSPLSSALLLLLQSCDVFFPVLHGPYCEDGTLQGFFDTLGKAYVGCDHRSAAICMDKSLTKKIVSLQGIAVVPSLSFSEFEWREQQDVLHQHILKELRYPVFVKPVHLGSTIGITKVDRPELLYAAVEAAFMVDNRVLVENGLQVREIEFAVIGNENPRTFPPGEILAEGSVYDYHGKYEEGMQVKVSPKAQLSDSLIALGTAWAKKAYLAAGCQGMARVDFFLDAEDQLWLNEINPIPGFTNISLFPMICEHNGLAAEPLMDYLLVLALERKRHLQRSLENV